MSLRRRPRAVRLLGLLLALGVSAAGLAGDLQVYLARHAEKAGDDPVDPGLSEAGHARAEALARALRDAGVSALYVTQFRRTQLTATPLAQQLGVSITIRHAERDTAADAAAFATELRARHAGEAVLVVGHSNTVPALADALLAGAARAPPLAEHDYDTLLLVTVPSAADGTASPARLAVLRYGAASVP